MTKRSTRPLCCTLKPAVFRFFGAAVTSLFVTFGVTAGAQECQRSLAPTVTFAEALVAERPSSLCVEIEGIAIGGTVYEDERAPYRRERIENDPSSTGAEMGYYYESYFDQPTRVRIVGRLSDCATEYAKADQQAPDALDMAFGYCHDVTGLIILATYVEPIGPAMLTRILPADRGDLGNIALLTEGNVRTRMYGAVNRFLIALLQKDRATLATLHGGGTNGRRSAADVERMLALLLDDPASPFAPLQSSDTVTAGIFGWKPPLWADDAWRSSATASKELDAIACLTPHPYPQSAALWPIDSRDTDNISGRPYACTRIHISGEGTDEVISFDTYQAATGFAEP